MDFIVTFLTLLSVTVVLVSPLLLVLCLAIAVLGLIVGRIESWSRFNAIYWAFITALTVGYGDIRPLRKRSKVLSIVIAWIGIMLTGLFVAMTVQTGAIAFKKHFPPSVIEHIEQGLEQRPSLSTRPDPGNG